MKESGQKSKSSSIPYEEEVHPDAVMESQQKAINKAKQLKEQEIGISVQQILNKKENKFAFSQYRELDQKLRLTMKNESEIRICLFNQLPKRIKNSYMKKPKYNLGIGIMDSFESEEEKCDEASIQKCYLETAKVIEKFGQCIIGLNMELNSSPHLTFEIFIQLIKSTQTCQALHIFALKLNINKQVNNDWCAAINDVILMNHDLLRDVRFNLSSTKVADQGIVKILRGVATLKHLSQLSLRVFNTKCKYENMRGIQRQLQSIVDKAEFLSKVYFVPCKYKLKPGESLVTNYKSIEAKLWPENDIRFEKRGKEEFQNNGCLISYGKFETVFDRREKMLSGGRGENESMKSYMTRSVYKHMKLFKPKLVHGDTNVWQDKSNTQSFRFKYYHFERQYVDD